MASVPPERGVAYSFYTALVSQANTKIFQANPTLAEGDAKVSIDGAAYVPLATLPSVSPANGKQVLVSLSAAEMTITTEATVLLSDAAGAEWCDQIIKIRPVDHSVDDIGNKTDNISPSTTLTTTPAVDGTTLNIRRGDSLSAAFTTTTDITSRTGEKLWFTIKRDAHSDTDNDAVIQISETTGLIRVNGAAASSAALGSITVSGASSSGATITIAIDETITDDLVPNEYIYDIQLRVSGTYTTLTTGVCNVLADVTRSVS